MNAAPLARILIVDDDAALLRALCDTLRDQGYETEGFTSADAALKSLRETPFDLLLADLMMPGMDGVTLLGAALKIDPHLVGIHMAGDRTVETAVQAMRLGALDYAERRATQARLAESERFNRAVLDALDANVAVLDAKGTIISTNRAWREFAAANGADCSKVSDGVNYLAVCARAAAEGDADAAAAARAIREVLEGGSETWFHEYPCHAPDAERWFYCRVSRFSDDGTVCVVVVHANITAMKLSQQRFHDLFEFAPEAILLTDRRGLIVQANVQVKAVFGWDASELVGQPIEVLLAEADRARHVGLRDGYIQSPTVRRVMGSGSLIRGKSKDGSLVPVEISLSPIGRDGDPLVVVFARDISDKVRQESDRQSRALAEAASEAKSTFLATMSHEIRTPMNAVLGLAEILQHSGLAPHQAELVETMQESGTQLLHLIDDVLDFSKIEAGQLKLEHSPVSLVDLIEGVGSSLADFAARREVEVWCFASPQIPARVLGDETRLRQLIYNLLGNAIKFSAGRSGQRGRVTLRAEVKRAVPLLLSLTVADNGIGIPPEVVEKLFTPFTQADAATTRRFGGTGLGLVICKRIVQVMGGEISVASALGEGATFTVTLPFEVPSEQPAASLSDVAGMRCIVVDSEAFAAGDVQAYLEDAGAQVKRAPDLAAAMAAASSLLPPVVVIREIDEQPVPAAFAPHVRYLIIAHGKRLRPRMMREDTACIDFAALRRRTLLHAVLMAGGRASPEPESGRPAAPTAGRKPGVATEIVQTAQCQLILVAEDDSVNQGVIQRQLALLGYASEIAGDGAQALQLWKRGTYALVLCDLHMPTMDGFELASAIRREEEQHQADRKAVRRIPILALTANALRGEERRAAAAGMDAYLTKPIALGQLRSALQEWLPTADNPVGAAAPETGGLTATATGALVDISVLRRLVNDDEAAVRELLNDYRLAAHKLAGELSGGVAEGDAAKAGAIAHRLKSAARTVGALALGDLCAELENAGKAGDRAGLSNRVSEFERILSQVDEEIARILG